MARLFLYDPSSGPMSPTTLEGLSPYWDRSDCTLWVDLSRGEETLLDHLGSRLALHPLLLDDCRRTTHLPKLDAFQDYLFLIVHAYHFNAPSDHFETTQLSTFLGPHYLLTYHSEPLSSIDSIAERCAIGESLLERGPAFLLHKILDALVDDYSPILDTFDEMIDGLEEEVFKDPSPATLRRIFSLRHDVVRLRRLAAPEREALFHLSRGDHRLIPQEVALYFRDVHDHLIRTVDLADHLRDTLTSLTEGYLSMVSNRINEVMRVLTVIATVMMPPTLLVGIYGMNFDFMPELKWQYGYFAVWGGIAAIAGAMLYYFKRKKWL